MRHQLILIAFGFGNLAMLGWLAAASAPLLIHLWSRHRFREAPWAAMQFLLAAMRKNARRLQLQQWLLLAVRTLIILLVVMAVAEPYGERLLAGGSATPSHKVLVIDGSYSMAYRPDGNTNFARAKQLAGELVRSSRSGDVFTVILMASPPRLIVGDEVVDRAAVISRIESLSLPHAGADLAGTLTAIQEALTGKRGPNSQTHAEVYFFTDLQARTWSGAIKPNQAAIHNRQSEIPSLVDALARRASLTVVDLGQPKSSNLAVTNVSTSEPAITISHDISFEATLHNFGQEQRGPCRVELLADDLPVGEQTVDVGAAGDAAVHFVHQFHAAGTHTLTVRASGDRLEIDNSRFLAFPVRAEVRVLLVAGREGAAKYLADALNPNPAGNSPIRPVVISEGDLAEAELTEVDCVFLCNVAQLTASEAARLTHYAEAGGGVVVFLGDRVVPSSYNALTQLPESAIRNPQSEIAPELTKQSKSLLPARIGPIVSQPQFGLDPLEYRHPIVAPFRGRERAGLLTTPVNRYYRLDLSRSRPGTEVAIAMPGGDPFIVTAPVGRGRCVLVATDGSLSSVDRASGEPWTTWPTWPSFLPIVRELLAYASGSQRDSWQQLVGTPLSGSIGRGEASDPNGSELHIVRPDGRKAPVALRSMPTGWEWNYADTDVSGIYSLRGLPQGGLPRGRTQSFAVNVDTAEGDLAKIDAGQLPAAIEVRGTWLDEANGPSIKAMSESAWSQSILWVVVALLFAESLMAWQFGRGAI